MKKFTGRYTTNTAKALKGSERILCQVSEDGTIYICNGFLLCTMNAPEYAATVQPLTCCEPGAWTFDKDGKQVETPDYWLANEEPWGHIDYNRDQKVSFGGKVVENADGTKTWQPAWSVRAVPVRMMAVMLSLVASSRFSYMEPRIMS